MNKNLVNVQLSVAIEEGRMIGYLQFTNSTSQKIYLDEQTICFYKKTYGNIFLIKDEGGGLVGYAGAKVKRDINPDYFQSLNPGEQIKTSVELSEVYEVKEGHKYTIQYCANNPPYKNEQKSMEMQSNKVEIIYQ